MELVWTGFLLGLIGSLHCAGMCGPLVLGLPVSSNRASRFVAGRLIYSLGRITTYCLIGMVFGLAGQSLMLLGFQRWLSVLAGVGMITFLILSTKPGLQSPFWLFGSRIKQNFRGLLAQRSLRSTFLLGAINGLLPCGLVYAAASAAASAGSVAGAAAYMLVFGLGTLPMMLGIAVAGRSARFAFKLPGVVPIAVTLVAVLLVVRGMGLGIPYLSPALDALGKSLDCH